MSERYPGGYITKNAPQPTGGEQGVADGVWTLEQALEYKQAGNWPIPVQPVYIEDVFSTYLYTGNGSTQTINNGINLSGKGGLVWVKKRSAAESHFLVDSARGAFKLETDNTNAQGSQSLLTLASSGFNLLSGNGSVNGSGTTYASWSFRKQPKFFDVVTWTGNNASERAIPHNLGSVPGCIIVKAYTGSFANLIPWIVYHRSLPKTGGYPDRLELNSTGTSTPSTTVWGSTAFTSTNFYIGSDDVINNSNKTYIAYVFAHDAGGFGDFGSDNVISCGSFTTNSTGNATINLGYEPQFLLMKSTTSAWNWFLFDTMRGWNQVGAQYLQPNLSNAETSNTGVGSPTATGFTASGFGNTQTHIYIAIRRGPMKTPTTGTSVFKPTTTSATTGASITVGFPTDMQWANYLAGDGNNTTVFDRLRGLSSVSGSSSANRTLFTSSTSAESSVNGVGYFTGVNNTGWIQGSYASGVDTVRYDFRRAPGFFDVVCYTGTGSATTVAHNLGVAPEFMIVKTRSATGVNWSCYHSALGNTQVVSLNEDIQAYTSTQWNNTTPTSSVFSVGTQDNVNGSSKTYVAYLFATLSGVSKVGSYTGTGTTKQVDCGFTGGARFVLIKRTDESASGNHWYVWDSARGIVAGNDPYLLLNSTAAEVTNTDYVDTYSAGFEISSTAPAAINANGGTFIYLAIA